MDAASDPHRPHAELERAWGGTAILDLSESSRGNVEPFSVFFGDDPSAGLLDLADDDLEPFCKCKAHVIRERYIEIFESAVFAA